MTAPFADTDLFAHGGGRDISVSGPHLEDEAVEPHRGFCG